MVIAALLTPFWVFKELLFPFITSKAFYLRILVEITLPLYVYLLMKYPQYRPSWKNPLTISITAFLFLNFIAAIFGVNPLRGIWGNFERMGGVFYLAHLTMLYFYVLLLGQMGGRYMRWFLDAVIWSAALITLDGILVQLTHNHFLLSDPSYPRVSGTFGNPIFIASYLVIPMFLSCYYMVLEDRRWLKIVYGIVAFCELYLIVLSQTRGAVVGVAAALFVGGVTYVFLTKQKQVRKWGIIAVVIFIALTATAFTQHAKFKKGSLPYRVLNLKDSNTESRLIQWGVALKGYTHYPILGVGPEDYYFLSNKYYNPAIYQYDPSWFDKPHNYLIEVLVTTGIVGFGAYAAILGFFIWILYRAYKKDLLSLMEFCLLLSGFLAYEFQNLTVFDTISASLMFFAFLGFGAFLWQESMEVKKPNLKGLDAFFIAISTGLTAVVMIYVIYVCNVYGIRIAKDINYGYAYSTVDPQIAYNYFQTAGSLPFDFDPIQFSSKYADFASALAANPGGQSPQFVNQVMQDAITAQQDAINEISNDPTAWQELSNLYLNESIVNKTSPDPKALEAADEAISLAPRRPEPLLQMARVELIQNNLTGAEQTLLKLLSYIPEEQQASFELALVYNYSEQTAKAVPYAEQALAEGFTPTQAAQIDWLAQYYTQKQDWSDAERIFQMAVKIDPANFNDDFNLAQVYYELGQKSQAVSLAQQVARTDPSQAAYAQGLIASFK